MLAWFLENVPQSQTQTGIRTQGDVFWKFDVHVRCLCLHTALVICLHSLRVRTETPKLFLLA